MNDSKNKSRILQNILLFVVLAALLVLVRLLLGTKTYMYLYARDIDHVDVHTTSGIQLTSTGDDTARLVSLFRGVITHIPANAEPEDDTIYLTFFNKDGSQTEITVSGQVFTRNGKVYKAREMDGESVKTWLNDLVAAQQTA